MEFAEAVRQCVDTMGAGIVRDSRRFVSCLLDYADDSLALRVAVRNLDDAALAPFVEALDAGDAGSLGLAAAKVEFTLRNDRGLEASVAHDIASAISEALLGVLAPPPKQKADAQGDRARQAGPAPSPVRPQRPQKAASQPSSQAYVQSTAPAPKGRTFLGHGFWWWYGVSFILIFFAIPFSDIIPYLSLLLVGPNALLSGWGLYVKLPVFLYRKYGPKKKTQP